MFSQYDEEKSHICLSLYHHQLIAIEKQVTQKARRNFCRCIIMTTILSSTTLLKLNVRFLSLLPGPFFSSNTRKSWDLRNWKFSSEN